MKSSTLAVLLGFVASAYAAALTLQSPRFTVTSSDGEQIRSEPYVSLVDLTLACKLSSG